MSVFSVKFCLIVPDMWPDGANDTFLRASREDGIDPVLLIVPELVRTPMKSIYARAN